MVPASSKWFPSLFAFLAFSSLICLVHADAWDVHVRPLLESKCFKCHGGVKQKGGLDLRSLEAVLKGGDSGAAILPGNPTGSLMLEMVHPDAETRMPPKGDALTASETQLLESWIASMEKSANQNAAEASRIETWAPPEGTSMADAINMRLVHHWEAKGVQPAERCDDTVFARRAYLDLAGRIPTSDELDAFEFDSSRNKRAALIQQLFESQEYSQHMASLFNVVILKRDSEGNSNHGERSSNRWFDYLRWAFSENRPWDQLATDMILARPIEEGQSEGGASWFLADKKDDPNSMATETARVFLGKHMQCAQCHDHPVSPEIEQRHYWGMVAFFTRSYRVQTPHGMRVGESAVGGYSEYKNLSGEAFQAELNLLSQSAIPEEKSKGPDIAENYVVAPPATYFEQKKEGKEKKDKKKRSKVQNFDQVPVPLESRRAKLVDVLVRNNSDFDRAAVNRFWAYLTGRGLVHPVDQMDSSHPASHPQLLSWLGREFASSKYDIRRLISGIMLSDAYQLDSNVPAETSLPPPPESFSHMRPRPLSAEALYRSLLVASGRKPNGNGTFDGIDEDHYRRPLEQLFPDLFPEVISPRVHQALFFTNNALVDTLTSSKHEGSLAASMLAEEDPAKRTELAFRPHSWPQTRHCRNQAHDEVFQRTVGSI